jgi:hypothetical protein
MWYRHLGRHHINDVVADAKLAPSNQVRRNPPGFATWWRLNFIMGWADPTLPHTPHTP